MKLRVLGSAGAELPDFRPPAFLVDDSLLLDAGTIGAVLGEEEQKRISDIYITHSHLDHIRAIPALADNIILKDYRHTVTLHGTRDVVDALRTHLFNGIIWPDFSVLPDSATPVIRYEQIEACSQTMNGTYLVTAIPVNHTVPAVGYLLQSGGVSLLYTGDTGPTDEIWNYADGIDALIVEVSFPDSMESLALMTGHLSCSLLKAELAKIRELPRRILITHPKPQYVDTIRTEIMALGLPQVELLRDGALFEF